jgi:hypothetical protein
MQVYKFRLIESDGVVLMLESTCEHLAFITLGALVADIDEWEIF